MRLMSIMWILLLRLPWPLLLVTVLGWALTVGSNIIPTMPDLCLAGTSGQTITARAEAALAGGDLTVVALSWCAMLMGMMAPLLAAPLLHVWQSNLRHRRWRVSLLFLLPYLMVWVAVGVVLIPIAFLMQASFMPALLGGTVTLIWQITPLKQMSLNACHQLPGPSVDGEFSALRFGLSHARACVGTCWAFMLLAIVVTGPIHWVVMATIVSFSIFERRHVPRPPRWFAAFRIAPHDFSRSPLSFDGGLL
ncbi:DUF2182 domain-containing protein [Mesorhizobium sp. M0664]|uniref:copper chaperone n=1 Tax=Mesorhizobium sp. M0664 TaxID=2956982 RepID=UPI0033365EA2